MDVHVHVHVSSSIHVRAHGHVHQAVVVWASRMNWIELHLRPAISRMTNNRMTIGRMTIGRMTIDRMTVRVAGASSPLSFRPQLLAE